MLTKVNEKLAKNHSMRNNPKISSIKSRERRDFVEDAKMKNDWKCAVQMRVWINTLTLSFDVKQQKRNEKKRTNCDDWWQLFRHWCGRHIIMPMSKYSLCISSGFCVYCAHMKYERFVMFRSSSILSFQSVLFLSSRIRYFESERWASAHCVTGQKCSSRKTADVTSFPLCRSRIEKRAKEKDEKPNFQFLIFCLFCVSRSDESMKKWMWFCVDNNISSSINNSLVSPFFATIFSRLIFSVLCWPFSWLPNKRTNENQTKADDNKRGHLENIFVCWTKQKQSTKKKERKKWSKTTLWFRNVDISTIGRATRSCRWTDHSIATVLNLTRNSRRRENHRSSKENLRWAAIAWIKWQFSS